MPTSLTSRLTVDLDALVANWVALDSMSLPEVETAAVVKGDGYGCGAAEVGRALARDGVETFFVAVPAEGVALREAIGDDRAIYILGGYGTEEQLDYRLHDLRPVLNSANQAFTWFEHEDAPCAIQLDTGMNRLGMEAKEFASLGRLPDCVDLVMSHMGNADDPADPLNEQQLETFCEMTEGVQARLSLSATAGMLLGPDFHFDMVRPGIGLYGGAPYRYARPVVRVESPVIQVRDVAPGETVGYGATFVARRPTRIATISAGYADGLIRALGHGANVYLRDVPVPLAGRVSMDLITLDVTGLECRAGDMIEIIGPNQDIDRLAKSAGTIGHEILTSLGPRYGRIYSETEDTELHQ
ncbi:MAG: alanine racemase [Pseudomonadota bacterium]